MKILVTGAAGFVGFHLVNRLLQRGDEVVGIDNLNDYYDVGLKLDRLKEAGIDGEKVLTGEQVQSKLHKGYRFCRMALQDSEAIMDLFEREKFDRVCSLGAQAGVRYSLENPKAYIDSNIHGFLGILEAARKFPVEHLVYASSSSVYGNSPDMPLSTDQRTDCPVSLYAATKKSNELMAYTYGHLFGIPSTGLRFFTVYGPWGRPDMAYFSFTRDIIAGKPIRVFNQGDLYRDFTYIDDIVEGVVRVIDRVPEGEPSVKVYNIGNSDPVRLDRFIGAIETAVGKEAVKEYFPMQPGDVYKTYADVKALENDLGYHPSTPIETGIQKFVAWYKAYYHSS